jgi:hypothetical protein
VITAAITPRSDLRSRDYERRQSNRGISHYIARRFHYRITCREVIVLFFINLSRELVLSDSGIVRSLHPFSPCPLPPTSLSLSLFLSRFLSFPSLSFLSPSLDTQAVVVLDTLARHSLESSSTLWQPLRPFTSDITRTPAVLVTTSHFRDDRSPTNKIDVRLKTLRHVRQIAKTRIRRELTGIIKSADTRIPGIDNGPFRDFPRWKVGSR